jgi:hypothetical protein
METEDGFQLLSLPAALVQAIVEYLCHRFFREVAECRRNARR